QIFLDNSATDFGYVARKECQPAADEITRLNPHRLYQRYRNANGEILGEMTNLAEHERSAKTQLFGSQMTNPGWPFSLSSPKGPRPIFGFDRNCRSGYCFAPCRFLAFSLWIRRKTTAKCFVRC